MGGSIGMIRNQKTGRIEPLESLAEIHRFLPDAQSEVSLDFFTLGNLGSSEVTPDHWKEIAASIHAHYDAYEGFVVIHGTNTMSYTAAALSFALQHLSKPVVLVGSLMPLNDLGSDGRMNLISAIRAAQLDLAEVVIASGSCILRGCRAKKVDQSIAQTFDTPKLRSLAELNVTVSLSAERIVRRKRVLDYHPTFDTNIVSITLHPGMPDAYFDALFATKPHGIVIRAYGQGMLPEHVYPWIRKANEREIPIVITSQLMRGSINLHQYVKQLALEELGVMSGKDMTYECAVVKLMWALKHGKTVPRIREIMEKNLVGELTE